MANIPITVVGGYLGSGKTTLINHLLRNANGLRLAVLVNDFGELPIDASLIESEEGNVLNIAGGCVCCSYGSDLIAAMQEVLAMSSRFDHVVIEASGVALPGAIARSVSLIRGFAPGRVLTLLDCERAPRLIRDRYVGDTVMHQIEEADIVILTKPDIVDAAALTELSALVRDLVPYAGIRRARHGELPADVMLGQGGRVPRDVSAAPVGHHHARHFALTVPVSFPVVPEHVAEILARRDLDLVRAKGFVTAGDGTRYLVQVAGRRWDVEPSFGKIDAPDGIVCIRQGAVPDGARIGALIRG